MAYQNLFEALQNVCGFTALESDMLEIIRAYEKDLEEQPYEPYFGWCDVEGCDKEGCSGGNAWRHTGYWTVCPEHSKMHREGQPQPKMKQTAIERENSRLPDGTLPSNAEQKIAKNQIK